MIILAQFVFFVLQLNRISSAPKIQELDGKCDEFFTRFFQKGLRSRIIGGQNIDITQVPFIVSLRYYNSHICGASIITPIHVVTAAHCVYKKLPWLLDIHAGSTFKDRGLIIPLSKIRIHPFFVPKIIDYDIAVLKLAYPVPLSRKMQPIPLAKRCSYFPPGVLGVIAGWGSPHEGIKANVNKLQGTVIQVFDYENCNRQYDNKISERMICAGSCDGSKDTCQGDSGGPLIIDGVLAGVTSFGRGCGRPGVPGIYTNVSAVRDFIDFTISCF